MTATDVDTTLDIDMSQSVPCTWRPKCENDVAWHLTMHCSESHVIFVCAACRPQVDEVFDTKADEIVRCRAGHNEVIAHAPYGTWRPM